MGAAVGTQQSCVEGVVDKARKLLKAKPEVSNEELAKELPPEIQIDEKALVVFRRLASVETMSNADLWEEVCGARQSPRRRRSRDSATTTFLMSPEFKRPQMSKTTRYPPLKDSSDRPLSRALVGSYSCHGMSEAGKAKENQDRGIICHPFKCGPQEKRSLFVVADGHGDHGHLVSDFVVKKLVELLATKDFQDEDLGEEILREAFLKTNDALTSTASTTTHAQQVNRALSSEKKVIVGLADSRSDVFTGDSTTSGTTCLLAILREKFVITANVGDSRCVVGRVTDPSTDPKAKVPFVYEAQALTVDHKPDAPAEKARIEEAGGFVSQPDWSPSARVWLDPMCTWPGLAMARSIGDICVKHAGVIADPDVSRYDFRTKDKFLVMATDDIWEFLSSDDVVQIVAITLHSPKHKDKTNLAEICAQEIIKVAMRQWRLNEDGYRDDITCTVIILPLDL